MTERIGIEIRREDERSWREVVAKYARLKNLVSEAIIMFDEFVEAGYDEPWAALKALENYGCVDVICGNQHLRAGEINNFN